MGCGRTGPSPGRTGRSPVHRIQFSYDEDVPATGCVDPLPREDGFDRLEPPVQTIHLSPHLHSGRDCCSIEVVNTASVSCWRFIPTIQSPYPGRERCDPSYPRRSFLDLGAHGLSGQSPTVRGQASSQVDQSMKPFRSTVLLAVAAPTSNAVMGTTRFTRPKDHDMGCSLLNSD